MEECPDAYDLDVPASCPSSSAVLNLTTGIHLQMEGCRLEWAATPARNRQWVNVTRIM